MKGRGDARERARRDFERLDRREPEEHWWRSLALVGSVGWPIVLLAAGGAFAGRALDHSLASAPRFTLLLLLVGTAIGSFIAYRNLREHQR